MKSPQELAEEYFKEIFPDKVFVHAFIDDEHGGYFKIGYEDTVNNFTSEVTVNYLEFITWIFNNYISPEKIYINLN